MDVLNVEDFLNSSNGRMKLKRNVLLSQESIYPEDLIDFDVKDSEWAMATRIL